MKITVDANILFACIIREGNTRKLWFNSELILFAPRFILEEFEKYKSDIKKKTGLETADFNLLQQKILQQIQFVSDEELKPFLPASATLSKDEKDWLYFACALKENTVIWSNDNEMKNQSRIIIKTTNELIEEIGLL